VQPTPEDFFSELVSMLVFQVVLVGRTIKKWVRGISWGEVQPGDKKKTGHPSLMANAPETVLIIRDTRLRGKGGLEQGDRRDSKIAQCPT